MSYVHSHDDPAARVKALAITGGVHALIGAGLVLGLTYSGVIEEDVFRPTKQWPVAEPTTPPPPPDTTDPEVVTAKPVAPIPDVDLTGNTRQTVDEWTDQRVPEDPGLVPTPTPTATFAPTPTPTATFTPMLARPRNSPLGWISSEDYPGAGIRRGLEGTTAYRLVIGSDGRVDACEITASSGHAVLDSAACRLLERRARFDAARDGSGQTVVGTYSGQVTWRLPE